MQRLTAAVVLQLTREIPAWNIFHIQSSHFSNLSTANEQFNFQLRHDI